VLDAARDASIGQDAENEENQTALENLERGPVFALDGYGPRKGKHQRNPDDECEERKDQVIEMKPRPRRMLQTIVQAGRHGKHFRHRFEDLLHADDEEHVHAPKRINGHNTLHRSRRPNPGSFGQSGRSFCRSRRIGGHA
jgi:hypothetical protein